MLEFPNIFVRKLSDNACDIATEIVLTSIWALEAVRKQVFWSLTKRVVFEDLLNHEVDHLRTQAVSWLKQTGGYCTLKPTSDWGEVGPVSVLARMERDWDWVNA